MMIGASDGFEGGSRGDNIALESHGCVVDIGLYTSGTLGGCVSRAEGTCDPCWD